MGEVQQGYVGVVVGSGVGMWEPGQDEGWGRDVGTRSG